MSDSLKVLVLGGGPDRERPVSLKSAAAVAEALRRAGHAVIEADCGPGDEAALDTECDVVFPLLHGPWGEGGPLQRLMDDRALRYVGAGSVAAEIAMDKRHAKTVADRLGIASPEWQELEPDTPLNLAPPLVLKPTDEGSSFGVTVCHSDEEAAQARRAQHAHFPELLAERYIEGRELTVAIVGDRTLPPIEIVPADGLYDYEAKYDSDRTQYLFEIDLPAATLERVSDWAWRLHRAIGCRELSRMDFLVDRDQTPWFLEANTMPGFTDHSLVPMAAARVGIEMPALCDRLVRLALER